MYVDQLAPGQSYADLRSAISICLQGREGGELSGRIQLLQEFLGEQSSSTASLRERTIGELSGILADLQQRLRSRGS